MTVRALVVLACSLQVSPAQTSFSQCASFQGSDRVSCWQRVRDHNARRILQTLRKAPLQTWVTYRGFIQGTSSWPAYQAAFGQYSGGAPNSKGNVDGSTTVEGVQGDFPPQPQVSPQVEADAQCALAAPYCGNGNDDLAFDIGSSMSSLDSRPVEQEAAKPALVEPTVVSQAVSPAARVAVPVNVCAVGLEALVKGGLSLMPGGLLKAGATTIASVAGSLKVFDGICGFLLWLFS